MDDQPIEPEEQPAPPVATTEAYIRRAVEIVDAARPMPLSASVMISKEEVIDVLEAALREMPAELESARFLLRERDDVLNRARADAEAIIRDASSRAEQLVQRTEVVRAAEEKARRIVAQAETDGRRLQMEVEDFCDQRLASFEVALDRVRQAVEQGRAKLQPTTEAAPEAEAEPDEDRAAFFDQEQG
ncbi:MAG: hypothetical protein AAGA17_13160 [Actinomycetota bacterium]